MITPILRKAKNDELSTILSLYQSMIGKTGCAWNEFYPSTQEINSDFEHNNLFVLTNENEIIGAVSVLFENELSNQDCFKIRSENEFREIARVVISDSYQGRGLAKLMLTQLFSELKKEKIQSVHLSVFKSNPAAIKTYKSLEFNFLKETKLYGGDYYLCEKIL